MKANVQLKADAARMVAALRGVSLLLATQIPDRLLKISHALAHGSKTRWVDVERLSTRRAREVSVLLKPSKGLRDLQAALRAVDRDLKAIDRSLHVGASRVKLGKVKRSQRSARRRRLQSGARP